MRNKFLIIALLLIMLPLNTFADETAYYTNQNGIEMSQADYEAIIKMYSEGYAATMTQDQYNHFKSLNVTADDINPVIKYIKSEYNNLTGEVTNTEITENEFNNAQLPKPTKSMTVETVYKRMSLTLTSIDEYADVVFSNKWKLLPSTRSFDVLAMRFINLDDINGTQAGDQTYSINGVYNAVTYSWNGTNINRQSNGFGISMNLIDSSSVTSFDMHITAMLEVTGSNPIAYATYQHATSNVTLAQSKNYTLGAGGLGSVINFNNNIDNYYDGTTGLSATL